MAVGFAPRHLESEIVALGQPGDAITAGQFTGEEAPPSSYFEGLVAAICRRWLEDGKPKAIVRVPPMQGGKSAELVASLLQALTSNGARVLDATGTAASDKERFLTALEAEENRTHAASAFDVMLGIQRVLEGTNWPVCSAVYCVGMPGSLNTVVQFLGRAMRLKSEDYPATQRDRARLVFFVPCGGGTALADLSLDHSRHALLTCCFLADHEVGQEWIVLREVRRGIEAALGSRTDNPAAADAENEADEPLDPEVRAEVELVMANAREQIISEGGAPTVGEVLQLSAKTRPDLPEAAFRRVAAEVLASQPGTPGDQAREAIQREVAKKLRINPLVKKVMEEAFAVVLEEFRDVTLKDSAVLRSVGRQIHGVTGRQMGVFAQRLREAAPRPLTEEWICDQAKNHHERTQEWPKRTSGELLDAPGENWANIDAALQQGRRGLPGGSSLAGFLEKTFGVRNLANLPSLTEEWIRERVRFHRQNTGKWPQIKSGELLDSPGEVWANIHGALQQGGRKLPGGSSLPRFLKAHFELRNPADLNPLTEGWIHERARFHHQQTGEWPTRNSGTVLDAPGETWTGIDQALHKGRRQLKGGSSLARFLADHFGVRNIRNLPPLTEEWICERAKFHRERTGKWPKFQSGRVLDVPGETWANIHGALQQGGRKLPGGSSLAQLLEAHFEIRNHKNLPRLTEEWIRERVRVHHGRTGQWPRVDSGQLLDVPGETWANINANLSVGGRGLAGASSLAMILEQHFGVRNRKHLPKLTENWIHERVKFHYEQTGQWPTAHSGKVLDAPGETWMAIAVALRQGRRGLPGGFSLSRFLSEQFSVRNKARLVSLTEDWICERVRFHHAQTGQWPTLKSGGILDAPGETWCGIGMALRQGHRGLTGNSSLSKFLSQHFGVQYRRGRRGRRRAC